MRQRRVMNLLVAITQSVPHKGEMQSRFGKTLKGKQRTSKMSSERNTNPGTHKPKNSFQRIFLNEPKSSRDGVLT
ncbi:hypothetical protein C463_04921 [Halorubrum californiense DSM 19288]|uniref:Uncharacterized protein n=1 Tax=Halorubrum californiense DSM 19288 TaxID=1227465 RepID=M0EGC2_9EURY|nr:hypothetical protein C463_04921 [Halorubrum californiense DSM 19288]